MIFKCKNCGGNAVYEPEKGKIYCRFCDSTDSEEQSALEQKTEVCGNCGGELHVEQFTSASRCPYCDNYLIFDERVKGEFRPHLILPFKYGREKTKKLLRDRFASCIFAPSDFLSDAKLDTMRGMYVPFWMYDYAYKCGFDGEGSKIRVWRTGNKEYTETSVYHIVREMDVDFEKVPVDASAAMKDEIMDLMEPYDYKALEEFQEKYMSGFFSEKYNDTADVSETRALQKANQDSERLLMDTIGGYSGLKANNRNIRGKRTKAEFALLPVWMYTYKYKGEDYLFHVNGQTGKIVGKTPTDVKRVLGYGMTVFGGTFYIMFMLRLILMFCMNL